MAQPDIDGALVGGASLDPDEFAAIVAISHPYLTERQETVQLASVHSAARRVFGQIARRLAVLA